MISKETLDKLDKYGFGADIDAFESYVMDLQDAAGEGNPEVTDAQYDDYVRLLKELKPSSTALNRNWETEDTEYNENYDKYLESYGMKSIRTIQNISETEYFRGFMPSKSEQPSGTTLMASSKINGHGVRAVYKNGELVEGTTRGRLNRGRDITRQLRIILPKHIDALDNVSLVEVRGELYCKYSEYEKIKHLVKTPLSAVTSMSRDSATDAEVMYLDFLAYQILTDEIEYRTLSEKFDALISWGFDVPMNRTIHGITYENFNAAIKYIIDTFETESKKGFEYDSDGIVVAIDDIDEFMSLGAEGNTMLGNMALKVGIWESNIYSSVIKDVEWCYGKTYITPKAHIIPVIARSGAEISTVPLYNIGAMTKYGLYPNCEVFFRFGGETGVTLCTANGKSITEDS